MPVLARLPITKDFNAWDCDPEDWKMRSVSQTPEEENLISYGDLTSTWSRERATEELGPYGKLLLAACRGKDDPRLLE